MEAVPVVVATRVLLLTQWFDPEPTFKGLAFAKALVEKGFEVEVVTGFPNYPGGDIYPGYKIRPFKRELVAGVNITRVALYPSHSGIAIGRILNYVSFSFSALIYCLFKAKRPDVIYAYHPPLTVGIAASIIRFFRSVPVVYDIQDMWPDTLRVTGMFSNETALRWVSSICNWVYRHVDQIVVLSPGFKQLLIERGVPEKRIEIIYNWCNEEALSSPGGVLPEEFPGDDRFRIVFAGNMGKAQALEAVLDAADILQHRNDNNISFVFVGAGVEVEHLKAYSREKCLANVQFIPRVPMSDVGCILKEADALLVHLANDPLFQITIPSKIQAYMAIGKPILMGVDGDAADIVRAAGCGETALSEDSRSIADAALNLQQRDSGQLEEMGNVSRDYYYQKMALAVGVEKFSTLFRRYKNEGKTKTDEALI